MSVTVAALFVAPGGTYYGLPDVEPWGLPERDARQYAGPHPVVAHPPCKRWGRFAVRAFGRVVGKLGDDAGCFASALASVRLYGGVLEHPAGSHAWKWHGLLEPRRYRGWEPAGDLVGWHTCVEQGHYGHPMRKATWLYAVCPPSMLPALDMRPSRPAGFRTPPHGQMPRKGSTYASLGNAKRAATPPAFRDVLLSIARSARRTEAA